jgi:hypothetical protein
VPDDPVELIEIPVVAELVLPVLLPKVPSPLVPPNTFVVAKLLEFSMAILCE